MMEWLEALERHGQVLQATLRGVPRDLARWKAAPERWSILEVAGHLLDEEQDDFRARIRMTLDDPTRPWPALDPEGSVLNRNHQDRELADIAGELGRERSDSIRWLRSTEIDLDRSREHPQLGRLRVGDLLASWVAHDLLHLGQIHRIELEWVAAQASPYSIAYAGG